MRPQPPSILPHLLLESPWMLVIALAAAGLIVRYVGRQRGQPALARISWGLVLLAGSVLALAYLVTTPREALIRRTGELLRATAPLDLPAVTAMLDPAAVLVGPGGETWLERPQIERELESADQRFGLASHTLRYIQAQARDQQGIVEIDLRTTLREGLGPQAPIGSRWLLSWQRDARGEWKLHRLQWLELMNRPPSPGVWR